MRGTVDSIKQRLDIVDIVSHYLKLEKAGQNYKGKCPFHNEKTASFMVSPVRQNYYCFGCGAKGDIFTITEALEGVDFKEALRMLADKAGVEIEQYRGESKDDKEKLYSALEDATLLFESNLSATPEALEYLNGRGISKDSIKEWRLGYARDEWRDLSDHLKKVGYSKEILLKAGLIKEPPEKTKEAYDVFRGRIMFPIFDQSGRVIAFSGRALSKEIEAKYLNSPETALFQKSEVLYGLDKAKDDIRKKNFAVLVEGQIDLVLSHQGGVKNTVASSGTAFTSQHLARLKRLSPRIILAFDPDEAGRKAAEKSALLGLVLGMEVKIAALPEGSDPADLVHESPEKWKDVLRRAKHSIEDALTRVLEGETDPRKSGKLIVKKVLPLIVLLESSIERSHFVSLIAKRSGIREEIIWDDLKRTPVPTVEIHTSGEAGEESEPDEKRASHKERIEERLQEVELWQKELHETSPEYTTLSREKDELTHRLQIVIMEEERIALRLELEKGGDEEVAERIETLNRRLDEEKRKMV
ncbi:MAG: dnaG [Parcubacteria group bacterium]|nr:dnaG [Parcubacteria group bacterium]